MASKNSVKHDGCRGPLRRKESHGALTVRGSDDRKHNRVASYLSGLTLEGGDLDGEAFNVLPWERRFVRGAFRVAGPAALSVARGNGKSALVAGIATALVDPAGPLHGRRREAVAVASSFEQSRVIYEDVLGFLRTFYDLSDRKLWRVQDSANRATVEYRPTGARVRCIGSDPAKAHGLRPALALLDEPAQWDQARADRMLAAIRTGLGKVPGSKLIALGTRPADSDHWFAKMLDGGAAYAQCHAARADDPPFRARTWRKANPSLDHLPSLKAEIRNEAGDAARDASLLASFRALRLNMGVSDFAQNTLIAAGTWQAFESADAEQRGPYALGMDLGDGASMSAAAGYWPSSGRLEAVAAFPQIPGLRERGLRDGVGRLYLDLQTRGELLVTEGRAVSVESLLRFALEQWGAPAVIAADRYREKDLRAALDRAGVPQAAFVTRGQGFKDGAEDVRAFRRAMLEGKVRPVKSLLLRAAMAEARTVADMSANEKLSKGSQGGRRRRARDDAAAAAILAVAEGSRRADRPTKRKYRMAVA